MSSSEPALPWWEQRAKSPGEPTFEAERERLRAEMARAWRAFLQGAEQPVELSRSARRLRRSVLGFGS